MEIVEMTLAEFSRELLSKTPRVFIFDQVPEGEVRDFLENFSLFQEAMAQRNMRNALVCLCSIMGHYEKYHDLTIVVHSDWTIWKIFTECTDNLPLVLGIRYNRDLRCFAKESKS